MLDDPRKLPQRTKSSSETGPGSETRVQKLKPWVQKLQFRNCGSETGFVVFRNTFCRVQQLVSLGSEPFLSASETVGSETIFGRFRNWFCRAQKLVWSGSATLFSGFRNFVRRFQKLFLRVQTLWNARVVLVCSGGPSWHTLLTFMEEKGAVARTLFMQYSRFGSPS